MKFSLIIIVLSWISINSVHDFHLSKTDIHFKSEEQAIQITVHTFIDDMELALKAYDKKDLKLFQHAEAFTADSLLAVYFNDNLKVKVNNKPVQFEYLGKEASEDIQGVYSYLEILGVSDIKNLEVMNSILIDTYDDQRNIIVVKADGQSVAFHMLTSSDHQKSIDF